MELAVDLTIASEPSAPARARSAIRELNGRCAAELVERLTLIASELVTNTVCHATGAAETIVAVTVGRDRVVIEVASSGPPFDRGAMCANPGIAGGFGLRVVNALADRWWIEHDGHTRVVCELDVARPVAQA